MSISLKKTTWRNILLSRFTLGLLLLLMFGLGFSVYDRFVIEREMASRRTDKEIELEKLKERKADLEEKVDYLSNDWGVEAEIRKHFDVAKKDEQVVVLIEDERKNDEFISTSSVKSQAANSFWSSLIPW